MARFKKVTRILLLACTALLVFVLAGCGSQNKETTVKVGINPTDAPIWKIVKSKVKKEGINLKITEFSDYNQPNTALSQGELDINAYQHKYFLDSWNKAHHTDIVPIGNTVIQPMSIYSNKIKNLSDLATGSKVALPNDASNESRALVLLENAGLIKLDNKTKLATVKNVSENKLNLKFTLLDAAQTARSLDDVTIAVVNGNFASDAKLKPSAALYTEKINKSTKPWINFIAANKKDKDNKTYKKVVKAFQTKAVANEIKKVYGGAAVPAWNTKL
ncbi:MetQ/NlpA family ABC transporter substrate-binding protein [Companilactobacillus sp. HBUAS59699]|uniref:MetQ/NlpA family ABC transporter substrate-binding protein n=1 Tax=Companilactobacillus sp. HBUAS59699 TaxID=3109358 RepID=UPI002FF2A621